MVYKYFLFQICQYFGKAGRKTTRRRTHKCKALCVSRKNNDILLCVIWLERKYRWNCNTWTNTLTFIYKKNVVKTSFIHCFIVVAENLTWPMVFSFFCSWWPAEEWYLFAVLEIQKFEYLDNKNSFLDEIKSIFPSFWRAIISWKNKK